MSDELTTADKLRGLPWSILSNALNTFFVQFTFFGSVFILFLDELGLSKSEMGFLLSLMPFAGLTALFIAPAVARFGLKRTYIVFWGLRKVVAAFLLLTPLVMARFGLNTTLIYVTAIVALFALFRAIGETGRFPWTQEYVPNAVRGKYTATNNVFTTITGFMAVSIAGFTLGRTEGLTGYMLLIGIGVVLGLISVWVGAFIPGGAPVRNGGIKTQERDLWAAMRDSDFVRYLIGAGLITLATGPLGAFIPLFMQEEVGLDAGNIVFLQTGGLFGSLVSSYLWGWASDRYGSKPVMLTGIYFIVLVPLFWMIMPRGSVWSLPVALAIAFLNGIAGMAWGTGSSRLLFVSVVPPQKKTDYMALYYAWVGIVGGFSQLVGGRILDFFQGLSGEFLVFTIDPYLPLFLAGILLPLASVVLLQGIRAVREIGVGEFAGLFLHGNPFRAVGSLIGFHLAKEEEDIVVMTERLGQTRSPLTVDELLEALHDPRFNVRFEAVVAISRMNPDERLIEALAEILENGSPALSVIAAWALGRMGDERALDPLRRALDSGYRSVRDHSSRALGTLGDQKIVPLLLQRLRGEDDPGLRLAYAAALGKLGAAEAAPELLAFLRTSEDEEVRLELALALARIVGEEHSLIQLNRAARADAGTTTSRAMTTFRRRLERWHIEDDELLALVDECASTLARQELDEGFSLLARVIRMLPLEDNLDPTAILIVRACADRIEACHSARLEYPLLALHTLLACWPVPAGWLPTMS